MPERFPPPPPDEQTGPEIPGVAEPNEEKKSTGPPRQHFPWGKVMAASALLHFAGLDTASQGALHRDLGAWVGDVASEVSEELEKIYNYFNQASKRQIKNQLAPEVKAAAQEKRRYSNPELGIHDLGITKRLDGKLEIDPNQSNRVDWGRFFIHDLVVAKVLTPEKAAAYEQSLRAEIKEYQAMAARESNRRRVLHEMINNRGDYCRDEPLLHHVINPPTLEDVPKCGNCWARQQRMLALVTAVYPDIPLSTQEYRDHTRVLANIDGADNALEATPAPLDPETDYDGTVVADPTNYLSGYLGTEKRTKVFPLKHPREQPEALRACDQSSDLRQDLRGGSRPKAARPRHLPPEYNNAFPEKNAARGPIPKFIKTKKLSFEEAQLMAKSQRVGQAGRGVGAAPQEYQVPQIRNPRAIEITRWPKDKPIPPNAEYVSGPPYNFGTRDPRGLWHEEVIFANAAKQRTTFAMVGGKRIGTPHILDLTEFNNTVEFVAPPMFGAPAKKVRQGEDLSLTINDYIVDLAQLQGTPQHITRLYAGGSYLKNLAALPSSVISINLTDSVFEEPAPGSTEATRFRERKLNYLNLSNTQPLKHLSEWVPRDLKVLSLGVEISQEEFDKIFAAVPDLDTLMLRNMPARDLANINKLRRLTYLRIDNYPIDGSLPIFNFATVADLPLTTLEVAAHEMRSWQMLKNLKNLKHLTLLGFENVDESLSLDPLRDLPIEHLQLPRRHFDLSPLKNRIKRHEIAISVAQRANEGNGSTGAVYDTQTNRLIFEEDFPDNKIPGVDYYPRDDNKNNRYRFIWTPYRPNPPGPPRK